MNTMEEGIEPAELAVLALGRLRQGVRTRPLGTLAVVFGAGFVLGRGLPNFVVRLASALALRAIAGRVLVRSLQASDPSLGGREAHG